VQNKAKKCKVCSTDFFPVSSLSKTCSVPCAIEHNNRIKLKTFNAETRKRKRAIKTRIEWQKEAQAAFNAFIRARDRGRPCVSCNRSTGAKINAGHYRPVGSCPELRFNEINCHVQCEFCNNYKSGNLSEYRINLINRIGLPLVEWLDGPHKPLKATKDELRWIKQYYKDRTKEAMQWEQSMMTWCRSNK